MLALGVRIALQEAGGLSPNGTCGLPVGGLRSAWIQFLPSPTHEACLCCSAMSDEASLPTRQGSESAGGGDTCGSLASLPVACRLAAGRLGGRFGVSAVLGWQAFSELEPFSERVSLAAKPEVAQ